MNKTHAIMCNNSKRNEQLIIIYGSVYGCVQTTSKPWVAMGYMGIKGHVWPLGAMYGYVYIEPRVATLSYEY